MLTIGEEQIRSLVHREAGSLADQGLYELRITIPGEIQPEFWREGCELSLVRVKGSIERDPLILDL